MAKNKYFGHQNEELYKEEKIEPEIKKEPVMEVRIDPGIVVNEYLTSYSTNRNLDEVFKKWFYRQDNSNPSKPIQEWDRLFQKFLNE